MPENKRLIKPAFLAFGLLLLGTWLLWAGKPSVTEASDSSPKIPMSLGKWEGVSTEVDDRAKDILETDQVELREYRRGQEPPVWFSQVSGFGNRAAFHPPELCYVGSHFEVLDRSSMIVVVSGRPKRVMRLVIGQGDEKFEAWYWFTANGRVTSNYYQQQLWLVLDSIRRKPASGTLVRVSTVLDDPETSGKRLLSFLTDLDEYLTRHNNEKS